VKVNLIYFFCLILFSSALWAERDIAIIIDTSGSMKNSDKPRYTTQLSKIITDLIEPQDQLNIIRFPGSEGCYSQSNLKLATNINTHDRLKSKQKIEQVMTYGGDNAFTTPIRTAIKLLNKNPNNDRLLLIIADSGGITECKSALNRELLALRNSHAMLAAINIGSDAGTFKQNPAFNFTASASDAYKLIDATAQIYQQFLGYKSVQKGVVTNEIKVTIAPYVQQAFLVVAADGQFDGIRPANPNQPASAINSNYATGITQGLDGVSRVYHILELKDPSEGEWRFHIDNLKSKAGWMLLQDSAVGLKVVSKVFPKNVDVPLEVEIIDKRTGLIITDPRILEDIKTSLKLGDEDIPLYDDGTHGDKVAGDGKMTGMVKFKDNNEISIKLDNQELSKIKHQKIKLVDGKWDFNIKTPLKTKIKKTILLSVKLKSIGDIRGLKLPKYISVSGIPRLLQLNDQGKNGDKVANDKIYSVQWTPQKNQTYNLTYSPHSSAFIQSQKNQKIQILGTFNFKNIPPLIFKPIKSNTIQVQQLNLATAKIKGRIEGKLSHNYKADHTKLEIKINQHWVSFDKEILVQLNENVTSIWSVRISVLDCPEQVLFTELFNIKLKVQTIQGEQIYKIPLKIKVIPDYWLHCWWQVLTFLTAILLTLIYIHGIMVSSDFSIYLVLIIGAEEEDLEDGLSINISRTKGAKRHFHQDAKVYLHYDYSLKKQAKGALLRLRAHQGVTLLFPMHNNIIERLNANMEWETCLEKEVSMVQNTIYKNSSGNLFFKLVTK